ncbi:LysR substrate-binding domain-containing protein [Pseudonocardia sp. H11422]|uniref:LysR substrate-binding domain-containing protein n=1 Tax=Pseudonocardia sp. H11422 TaxID=2835866 RepID=UPI001BDD17AE|nr:LysR substrate-binding domain-containing protein [Pseudonocardia sp. H11422]
MELRHLRAFTAVAEELHFGRAAQRLHMAQPPLSQQIRQLERDLGVVLLERTIRQVRLTNAGAVFLEHARRVLAEADRARESVLLTELGERGEIRVGLTGVTTWRMLPRMTRAYRKRYPLVRLELHPAVFSGAQISALHDGTIDVGFIRAPVPAPLAGRVLLDEPLVAVLPEEHPLAPRRYVALADLSEENFVTYPSRQGSSLRDTAMRACSTVGFAPRVVQEAPDTYTVVALVGAAVGVALLPASAERLQLEGVVFRPVIGADVQVPIALAWRAGDTSPVLTGFLAVAAAILPTPPQRPA